MTTPKRILALTALLAATTACADDGQSGAEPAASPSTTPSAVALARTLPAAAELGPATPAALFDCLVQSDVIVLGPYARDVADGVTAEALQLGVTDRPEADTNSGALYLFADEASATTYADAARVLAVEEDDLDPAAVAAVHGTVVLVVDRPLVPTAQEQGLLGCLPDADPDSTVTPPVDGNASLGSLMACAAAAGMHSQGEHTYVDEMEDRIGRVRFQTPSGFGGYDDRAIVSVYADAATAEAKEAELTDGDEPGSFTRRGNTVAQFWGPIDATDPTTAGVLACLPA